MDHPSTLSMTGWLMALTLLTTLAAAVIFQPALFETQKQTLSIPNGHNSLQKHVSQNWGVRQKSDRPGEVQLLA
jgi:hypothetical protein